MISRRVARRTEDPWMPDGTTPFLPTVAGWRPAGFAGRWQRSFSRSRSSAVPPVGSHFAIADGHNEVPGPKSILGRKFQAKPQASEKPQGRGTA
jgi:hypothetical protein